MRYLPDEEEEGNSPYPGIEYLSSSCDPSQDRRYRTDQGPRNGCKGCFLLKRRVDQIVPENSEKT